MELECFNPSAVFFKSGELLKIMDSVRELRDADTFLGREVFVDGRLMLVAMTALGQACRKARSLHVNVPMDGGFVKIWERNPQKLGDLVPGDMVTLRHQRPGATYKVQNVGTEQVNLVEQGRGRSGQTIWVRDGADVSGWA